MAVICVPATVVYKKNLHAMLQYLICTAQIDKLHYSSTFLVGLATVQNSYELIHQPNASVT